MLVAHAAALAAAAEDETAFISYPTRGEGLMIAREDRSEVRQYGEENARLGANTAEDKPMGGTAMPNLRRFSAGALVILCLVVGVAMADSPYKIYVDESEMQLSTDAEPVEVNGSVLLPMRDLFERLGATVVWDENSQRVFAVKDKLVMILPVDKDYAYFNGRSVRMPARAQLIGERTYVPLRFVSTIFGADVRYDPATKRIDITVTPRELPIDSAERLAVLTEALAATRQVPSYTGDLNAQYAVSIGDVTVPMEMQAHMSVASPTSLALDYSLSSAVSPDDAQRGAVVVLEDTIYLKAPGQEWAARPLSPQAGENGLVAEVLEGLTGGNLNTLPLAGVFGEVMLPGSDELAKMHEMGLVAAVDDLGLQEIEGRELQGYRVTIDQTRFIFYYSNLAGTDPRAQGSVFDNVQAAALQCEYWLSPEDGLIYQSSINLSVEMKVHPQGALPSRFDLAMTQRLATVNQPVEITAPIAAAH